MPQKLGKGGHGQQNYVPAGYGEASGTYGDNPTGSNKFVKFEKPDNGVSGEIEVKPSEGNSNNTFNNFNEYVDNKFSQDKDFGNGLKQSFNAGNKEQQDKLNYFVGKDIIKIERTKESSNYNGAVNLNKSQIIHRGALSKDEGETLYHEYGHAYDEFFARGFVDKQGNVILEGLVTEEDKSVLRQRYNVYDLVALKDNLSTGKILSNGKTLYETMQEEFRQMTKNKVWDKIIQDFHEEEKKEVLKDYPDYYDFNKKTQDIKNDAINQVAEIVIRKDFDDFGKYLEAKNKHLDDILSKNKEYLKMEKYVNDARFGIVKAEHNALVKFANLSDLYGIYKGIPYGFGSGHVGNYGKKIKGAMALEFFAEFNSSSARGKQEELDLYNKYMPNSAKAMKELVEIMDNAWKGIKK